MSFVQDTRRSRSLIQGSTSQVAVPTSQPRKLRRLIPRPFCVPNTSTRPVGVSTGVQGLLNGIKDLESSRINATCQLLMGEHGHIFSVYSRENAFSLRIIPCTTCHTNCQANTANQVYVDRTQYSAPPVYHGPVLNVGINHTTCCFWESNSAPSNAASDAFNTVTLRVC